MSLEALSLRTAIGMHEAGQLPQAEQLYREILEANPVHVEALHHLGVLAQQTGRHELAIQSIARAVAAHPDQAAYHYNLGNAHEAAGHAAEAQACYLRAIELDPSLAGAHFQLGRLCQAGDPIQARRRFERTIELEPHYAAAHHQLGLLLKSQGERAAAIAEFHQALAADPNCAEAAASLSGEIEYLESAALADAASAQAHLDLGRAYLAVSNCDAAIRSLVEAVRLKPGLVAAHLSLAAAAQAQGGADVAGKLLERIISRRPDHVAALVQYAGLLQATGRAEEALAAADRALAVQPELAVAHFERGRALQNLHRFDEAADAFRRALEHRPGYPQAYAALAILSLRNTSHRYRSIFIHIPKNGGTSIKRVLDLPGGGHRTWRHYATRYPNIWQAYRSFAVVRNPWDRAVSAYHHARMKESYWHNEQTGLHPDYLALRDKSFAECVSILYHQRERLRHDSWLSQSEYVVDVESPERPIMVGRILRYESLAEDFAALCRELGVPAADLPVENTSKRSRDYRSYYDDDTRRMLAEVYRADIERFGYAF
jgi:tetratricopeptide (TPR) repeat protein